jgi:hypothetical protein
MLHNLPPSRGRRHRTKIGSHTFSVTGIMTYMKNSGTLEKADARPTNGRITDSGRPTPVKVLDVAQVLDVHTKYD